MKVFVVGMWHLGLVTAGSLASMGHQVVCHDELALLNQYRDKRYPVDEPETESIYDTALSRNLILYTESADEINNCDIAWICYDTPVDDCDNADSDFVINNTKNIISRINKDMLVIISSQLPVGSCRKLLLHAQNFKRNCRIDIICLPENLRLGRAYDVFLAPDRVIAGINPSTDKTTLSQIFGNLSNKIVYMSLESAEMCKHAINSFLATSVAFANEVAKICEITGANAYDVSRGLQSDERIGERAYLTPGLAFAGGTLARDVNYLLTYETDLFALSLIRGVYASNTSHANWLDDKVHAIASNCPGLSIGVLGVTYKPNTNTLRRSLIVQSIRNWLRYGYVVHVFDPSNPDYTELIAPNLVIQQNAQSVINCSTVLVIGTAWDEFKTLSSAIANDKAQVRYLVDPTRHVSDIERLEKVTCFSVGLVHQSTNEL